MNLSQLNIKFFLIFTFALFASSNSYALSDSIIFTGNEAIETISVQPETEITQEESNKAVYKDGRLIFFYNGHKREIPAWLSLLPPLIAILLALLFREVISSLIIGIFAGVIILYGFSIQNLIPAFLTVVDTYVINSINDKDHISVILFSFLIGGMVALISRNGGMKGLVEKLSKYASTPVRGQVITWLLGIIVFFDDYANSLVVGNTMRSITDKLKISREKLSYIVDATAAPVASIAFITTWIGVELGFIQQAINVLNADTTTINLEENAYSVFVNSLQFSFYPILTIAFMLMLILLRRDFGPMYKAEKRARETGEVVQKGHTSSHDDEQELKALEPIEGIKHSWYNAIIPVATLIITVIISLFYTGFDASVWNDTSITLSKKLSAIFGESDSYKALVWASATGLLVAILMTLSQRLMNLHKTFDSITQGFKTMISTIAILILAWGIGTITMDLHTADFLTNILSDKVNPYWLAELTFLIAAVISFSTGTSFGTMTILYPIALPLTWNICHQAGLPEEEIHRIFYNVVSVVLAGSVFGDHCSPISDTTILSSLATSCPHIDHVRTQMPYALIVAVVSMLICTKLADFGLRWYLTYPIGIGILYFIIRFAGKRIEAPIIKTDHP